MKKFIMLTWLCIGFLAAQGQIIETSPALLQQSSKDIVITYHADQGSKGLMGVKADVFAHTGVITNKSNGSWAYAPSKWGDNDKKYQMTFVKDNTWELKMTDIRSYYGITDPEETVEKLCFVFRTKDCSKEGKTATGGDIFVDVHPDQFSLTLQGDAPFVNMKATQVTLTVNASAQADIQLSVNGSTLKEASKTTTLSATLNLDKVGQYDVVATATDAAGVKAEARATYLYAPAAAAVDFPGGKPLMGATPQDDGSVIFCLAAPRKQHVILVGSWDNYQPKASAVMNYQDVDGQRYFWTRVEGLDAGTDYPYYYLVDGTIKVGDPYARLVLDPYSDKWLTDLDSSLPVYPYDIMDDAVLAVYNSNLYGNRYEWKHNGDYTIPEHSNLLVYELLIRDFGGTSRTDDGRISHVRKQMNYLKNLGINTIEFMPVMEFNGNNSWGYNTNFYMALDKAYGTPEEFKSLIDLCHSYGFAVVLDIVFNQSDGLHPWYQMYDPSDNPFYNAKAPHAYSVLNDWRQENPLVKQQWEDAIRFWMTEYNVDGFRFDLVKGLGDSDAYANASESITNGYIANRVTNMKRLNAVIKSVKPDGIHINEHLAGDKEENEMAADGQLNWMNLNEAASQVAMGWESKSSLNSFYAPKASRTWGSTVSYAESHDEYRMAYKQITWGIDGVKNNEAIRYRRLGSVGAMMTLTPGSHMIWMFQELGADENNKDANGNNTDPKRVYWDRFQNNDNAKGLYHVYAEVNNIRNTSPWLFAQDAEVAINLGTKWSNGYTLTTSKGTDEVALLCNPSTSDDIAVNVAVKNLSAQNFQVLSQSPGIEVKPEFADGSVSVALPAGAFAVLGTSNLSEIDTIDGSISPVAHVRGGVGQILIDGNYSQARVYDLNGRLLPGLTHPAGLYIVAVDSQAPVKVVVR